MDPIGKLPSPIGEPVHAKKGHWKIVQMALDVFSAMKCFFLKLSPPLREITVEKREPETLPITFKSKTKASMDALKAAHLRFQRFDIDRTRNPEALTILDGSNHAATFCHFKDNDWEPGSQILLRSLSDPAFEKAQPHLQKKITYLAVTIERAKSCFAPPPGIQSVSQIINLLKTVARNLQDGECLLIPGGTRDHATMYELKKENGYFFIKSYNTGAGTETSRRRIDRFNVPRYQVYDINSVLTIIEELSLLRTQSFDSLTKDGKQLSQIVENIVTSHGGRRIEHEETHRTQDRGNCSWKCLSTWFREQCKDIPDFVITDTIITSAEKHASYAVSTLQELKRKQEKGEAPPISLIRFFKLIGYEKVRSEINMLFSQGVTSPAVEYDVAAEVYGSTDGNRKGTEEHAVKYLTSLTKRIQKESAVDRFAAKDAFRRRKRYLDALIDKLWALTHR